MIKIIIEIVACLAIVIYSNRVFLNTYDIRKKFICKNCKKMNNTVNDKCIYCNRRFKIDNINYITFTGKLKTCKNTNNMYDLKIIHKYFIKDILIIISCILLVGTILAMDIVNKIGV